MCFVPMSKRQAATWVKGYSRYFPRGEHPCNLMVICPHKPFTKSYYTGPLCLHKVSVNLHPPYKIRFLMQLDPDS